MMTLISLVFSPVCNNLDETYFYAGLSHFRQDLGNGITSLKSNCRSLRWDDYVCTWDLNAASAERARAVRTWQDQRNLCLRVEREMTQTRVSNLHITAIVILLRIYRCLCFELFSATSPLRPSVFFWMLPFLKFSVINRVRDRIHHQIIRQWLDDCCDHTFHIAGSLIRKDFGLPPVISVRISIFSCFEFQLSFNLSNHFMHLMQVPSWTNFAFTGVLHPDLCPPIVRAMTFNIFMLPPDGFRIDKMFMWIFSSGG